MSFDYEDVRELYTDTFAKDFKTPHEIQSDLFNIVYNRDYKRYLDSIEWDGLWLKHDTPEEARARREAIEERKREIELKHHPFKQWF